MSNLTPGLNSKAVSNYHGSAHGLPGGQGQDKPLLSVGAYDRPLGSVDIAGIMAHDDATTKKVAGTVGAPLGVVGLT